MESRRRYVGVLVVVMSAACPGGGSRPAAHRVERAGAGRSPGPCAGGGACEGPDPAFIRCPDEGGCTASNGTGVYHAEAGFAGIGASRLMITHFLRTGGRVGFAARYVDPATNRWFSLANPGAVYRADYRGRTDLRVVSLSETATVPTWIFEDPAAADPASRTLTVTGDELLGVKLYLRFTISRPVEHPQAPGPAPVYGADAPGVTQSYVLEFGRAATDARSRAPLQMYELRWRERAAGAVPVPYCVDARGSADPIVFQGGIAIDPDTARVTRGGSTDGVVTLSCRSGAPATVYSWGYRHREDAYYFDAALQMKRASYCGDGATYTQSPTLVDIADDRHVAQSPLARLEARWTPTGASCVNRDHLRHPEIAVEKGFTFTCQGRSLPPCTTPALGRYLASGVASSGR